MTFFEIDDNNGNPLNVIIRTRFSLAFVWRTSCCNNSMLLDSDWSAMGWCNDLNFAVLVLVAARVAADLAKKKKLNCSMTMGMVINVTLSPETQKSPWP